MGLFSKEKESCPICGSPLKLFKLKLKDALVCKDCEKKASLDEKLLKSMTLEEFKKHLLYREENKKLYESMSPNYCFKVDNGTFSFDETLGLVAISQRKLCAEDNPIVLRYNELTKYELKFNRKLRDDSDTEGDTYLLSKGGFAMNIVTTDSDRNEELNFILHTTNEYWRLLEVKLLFNSASSSWNETTAAAQAVGRCFKAAIRGYAAEEYMKNGVCIVGKNK